MTIFLSQRPNLDPEPWVRHVPYARTGSQERFAEPGGGRVYDPRPEFEPTRDPDPWVWRNHADPGVSYGRSRAPYVRSPGDSPLWHSTFEPRRDEYDTPVNRVLEAVRRSPNDDWLTWLEQPETDDGVYLLDGEYRMFTPAEMDHARRVLQRLASLTTKED